MRTPVKWDRGSVSVAPIAQPFKGILEDFGIPESAYSAEGGFGGSGLLDWEPADFISPEVVWGTQFVSGAPPPSAYGDVSPSSDDKKDDEKKDDEKEDDGCPSGYHKVGAVCVKDDDDISCPSGYHREGGVCVKDDDSIPDDPGQDDTLDESDDSWYDYVAPNMEVWTEATGPEPEYGDVFDDGAFTGPVITGTTASQQKAIDDAVNAQLAADAFAGYTTGFGGGLLNIGNQVDDFASGWPTIYGTPYEDEITSPFYDPWAFEVRRGGRR